MRLNLEAKTKEQELIKAYLEENTSETLAEKINNGVPFQKDRKTLINKKTLDGFFRYASDEARKLASKGANFTCVEDKVVYGWAVHYFEEDSIVGTLYNEDGTEYKIQPKAAARAQVVKTQSKPQPKPQMSMFDLMGDDLDDKPAEEKSDDEQDDMPSDEEIQEIMAEIAEEEQKKPSVSPVYRKYLDVQSKYPQAVIVMRLGDFYEVFGKNAEILADELPLTLTGRDVGLEMRLKSSGQKVPSFLQRKRNFGRFAPQAVDFTLYLVVKYLLSKRSICKSVFYKPFANAVNSTNFSTNCKSSGQNL